MCFAFQVADDKMCVECIFIDFSHEFPEQNRSQTVLEPDDQRIKNVESRHCPGISTD